MKIRELIEEIGNGLNPSENTKDTVKFGDDTREVARVAVTMLATVDVLKKAIEDKIDLLIVHEPVFYADKEEILDLPIFREKKELIEQSGITIYRFHDHPHMFVPDMITAGGLRAIGIEAEIEKTPYFASYTVQLDDGITALQMAERIQQNIGLAHVRICGSREKKCKKIAVCFGTPGGVFDLLCDESVDMVLTGEISEIWLGELARDADALGYTKSLLVLGHCGSEREGMRLLAERLKADTRFTTEYLESGEVYTYTN